MSKSKNYPYGTPVSFDGCVQDDSILIGAVDEFAITRKLSEPDGQIEVWRWPCVEFHGEPSAAEAIELKPGNISDDLLYKAQAVWALGMYVGHTPGDKSAAKLHQRLSEEVYVECIRQWFRKNMPCEIGHRIG